MTVFEFSWKGKHYAVEGTHYSLDYIVLPDTRKVVRITEWKASMPPSIANLIAVPHDMQESLAKEIAKEFNAAIAIIAEPRELKLPEKEE